MIIMVIEPKMKNTAKKLRRVLQEHDVELCYNKCLDLTARIVGFDGWQHYCKRDKSQPPSVFDHLLPQDEAVARTDFQVQRLTEAGLGAIAHDVLQRANPTGPWGKNAASLPRA